MQQRLRVGTVPDRRIPIIGGGAGRRRVADQHSGFGSTRARPRPTERSPRLGFIVAVKGLFRQASSRNEAQAFDIVDGGEDVAEADGLEADPAVRGQPRIGRDQGGPVLPSSSMPWPA